VQRRFTKRVPSITHLPYLDRLSVLKLQSLELRRLHIDLIQYYKIINHLSSIETGLISNYTILYHICVILLHSSKNHLTIVPVFNLLSSTDVSIAGFCSVNHCQFHHSNLRLNLIYLSKFLKGSAFNCS
jgi:hypothetical protein